MTGVAQSIKGWLTNYNAQLDSLKTSRFKLTPKSARQGMEMLTTTLVTHCPDVSLLKDGEVEGEGGAIPVRMYHPEPEHKLPVLVYLHGGGHMCGSIEVYDPICRKIALAARRIVVSVDYRLSPEFPYPAGIEDGRAVLKNCYGLLDKAQLKFTKRLALGGDSAGGAMSATLAHDCQYDPDIDISDLALIYPSLDYTMSSDSYRRFASGYLLERENIRWYFEKYFQSEENRRDASPLFMDVTSSFPNTFIVTAGYCPLCDEGIRFVKKLQDEGIVVSHIHFADMIHAFLNMEDLVPERCTEVYEKLGLFLR
ncbi:MAG: alpha/beta hydrolase [Desulforhopalus sp.]